MADPRLPSEPRVFPASGWDKVNPSLPVEKETILTYRPEEFYPVCIGEVFNDRYQVVGKLGYGSSGDSRDHRYIALKIYAVIIHSDYAGQSCLRPLIEIFQARSQTQSVLILVWWMSSLGSSLDQLIRLLSDRVKSSAMVRTTAQIVHTGITECSNVQPHNILLGIKDNSIRLYHGRPSCTDRTIEMSRPLLLLYESPALCDVGEARLGTDQQNGDIMPDIYWVLEVILDMSWNYKVDIWNVEMIWDRFEHQRIFRARDSEGNLNDACHLAETQAVLGGAPPEFLARSERNLHFWDEIGLSSPFTYIRTPSPGHVEPDRAETSEFIPKLSDRIRQIVWTAIEGRSKMPLRCRAQTWLIDPQLLERWIAG
ncbi:uncharacterized protein BP01DRAFT_417287 [Aspergillus saccharolyticus JOP 1030-1]|uniref:non-specific serine/threonine protein kinase n=1 Tax=Aspergillus saccharolyticus JOP 1030-1 TaxID=1450539 RepID=A0A318ZIP5_9EURO|nr:hypothetical protein BP01DRAFT_417287 [Aspergillus saccharolyticus JOP 1030-1]PYH43580.1 hypothetical protein BP01DRAFT_417287 [Aspergillus saccharolyticus JOP 1030-1]